MPSPPIPPEALLEHAAWLRRLATTLVGGDSDDLVQETWLAALRTPPAADRPARGWLAEVLRNAARMRARGAGRRARRETELVRISEDSAPSADALLDRLQAQRRLAALVAELEEPFRATVLLRYFEGLSAAEIARREGVPAGTVRWRLKEGLDRLRTTLDRESGGDRRRWCVLLAPGVVSREPSWITFSKGIWMMSRTAKLVTLMATLLLLLAGGGSWWRARHASHATVSSAASASLTMPKAPQVARPSVEPGHAAPLPLTAAVALADESAEHGVFEGRVIDWGSGKGVSRAEVTFAFDGATAIASTDEEGRFQLAPARAGRCTIALVTAPDYLPFAPEWGHSPIELFARPKMRVRDITVYLVPAIDYVATVVDPGGKPVAGATVTLLGAAQGEQALVPIRDRFISNDRGEVQFHAPDDALLEARHPDFSPGRRKLDGAAATSHRMEIRLRPKGAETLGVERIAGRVIDAGGAPVAGALVRAEPADRGPEALHTSARALSDAAGHFSLEGLDPGLHTVVAAHAGFASSAAERVSAGSLDLVLGLRRGGSLSGRVIEAEGGAPVPAFTIVVARRKGPVKEVSVAVRSVIDSDGRFTIPDLEPGDYRVRAAANAHAPTAPLDVSIPEPPTQAAPIQLALGRGGRLTGKVIDVEGGAPLAYARISIENAFGDTTIAVPIVASALTDDRGDFELGGIPPGARSIMVAAYAHHIRILTSLSFVEGATVGPITVDLTPTKNGEESRIELAGIGAVLTVDGDGLRVDKVFPGGGAEAAGLAPGDVLLAVDGASVATLGFDGSIQRIRGPVGSTVRLTLRRASGAVVEVAAERRRIRT
ncbi:Hypothetical protein A7982_03234 [Minicystis rosea]|nr:Hypothetical protein A7982_03234 [Minicystis rosea]